jgi:hypothetical protein
MSDPHAERRDKKRHQKRYAPKRDRFIELLKGAIVKRGKEKRK